MAECSSKSREENVKIDLYEHGCPDGNCAFHHIHDKNDDSRFFTKNAECIGGSNISASMFLEVNLIEPFPNEKAERYCSDKISEYQQ